MVVMVNDELRVEGGEKIDGVRKRVVWVTRTTASAEACLRMRTHIKKGALRYEAFSAFPYA